MHGLIFLQLQKFAQKQGPQAWEAVLREAGLPAKAYSPARAYPDDEAFALVAAASRVLKQPPAAVLETFGEFLGPELVRLYARLVRPEWKTLDLIERTEQLIHAAVRLGNPGAQPPVLDVVRPTPDEVQIIYSSERKLCHLARGILAGLASHYGESVTVTEEACMWNGDPFCALHVTRCRSITDTDADATEFGTVASDLPAGTIPLVGDPRFPFLTPVGEAGDLGRLADYRVLGLLGQGTMGIVFRAVDRRLDRLVALKVLQPRLAAEEVMRHRFLREARAVASVRNDHVVAVYEVGAASGLPFLAMEYLEGDSLRAYSKKLGAVPPDRTARIGRDAALGLAAVHDRGLVHRDIKPDNLWVEAGTGRVKILDFGLARDQGSSAQVTHAGAVLGTPAFMAPEQAAGGKVDHRADLFSLGCVLYRLCTGELPFKGPDVLSTLTALATHHPNAPGAISAAVPADLSDLIMHLLQKDPAARPASARAVAETLAAIERAVLPEPA